MTRVRHAVRQQPVTAFFLLAFLYSWAVFVLLYGIMGAERLAGSRLWHVPFAWGPPLAAVLVQWLAGKDLVAWLKAVADPRRPLRWYLLAAVLAFLFADTRAVVAGLSGVPLELARPPGEIVTYFLVSLFLAGALEEFGWRGFAQLRLQERWSALSAALVVGVAFGLWHLPWLLLGGAGYEDGGLSLVVAMTVFTVLASVIFAWLFNGSGGAVPVVMLAHATINAGSVLELAGPAPAWLPDTQLGFFLWIGMAIVLILVYGRAHLAPERPAAAARTVT